MNLTLTRTSSSRLPDNDMKQAVLASIMLHALIVLFSVAGLPFIAKPPPVVTPINVEIVTISDKTRAITPPKASPAPLTRPKPPPSNTADTPPDVTKEKPPEIKPQETKPLESIPLPTAEKPKEKPAPKPKEAPKPTTQPKATQKKKDFDSLLKNLAPDDANDVAEKPNEQDFEQGEPTPMAELGEALTMSELDAFRHQIEPCWNVPSGAKFAENLAVEVRVSMNRDATLQSAKVLDQRRYKGDTAFRAAADSALRALRNPRCSPLRLPADKYETWKTIVINFDPRDML